MLSVGDILFAAVLAFLLTWAITTVSDVFKAAVSRPAAFNYENHDLNKLLHKCYTLFPGDKIFFGGKTFLRGMNIRITTTQRKIIEGRLVGISSDNMLCLLTSKNLVAQQLESITEIITIDN